MVFSLFPFFIMEDTAHSPGPWNITDDWPGRLSIVASDGRIIAVANEFGAEKNANARLIAAAPELLDASKFALEELHCPDGDDAECGALAALRDAIATAEDRRK